MAPPTTIQSSCKEADIQLAILAISQDQIQSERRAASMYNIARTTLQHRRAGMPLQRDTKPNLKKLTELKEKVVVKHILRLVI